MGPRDAPDRVGALTELVDAVAQLAGLTEQVGPFSLPADTCADAPEVVAAVCAALDVPLRFDAATELVRGRRRTDHALRTVAAGIRVAQRRPGLRGCSPAEAAGAARAARAAEESWCRRRSLRRPDGTRLHVLDAGPRWAPTVVFSPACAMDARLCLPWVRALCGDYRCLVPQTRGTSGRIGDPADFDRRGWSVDDQAGDLVGVVCEAVTAPVHLLGMCGGAVPALAMAAARPDLVDSVSTWHGDLEFGGAAATTDHQDNLRTVLDMAGESRDTAAWMRGRLVSGPMSGVPEGIGPLVVRPYLTTELFYRYARLTGATMRYDCTDAVSRVRAPGLVVTSRDDHTAHPDGSRRLAGTLVDARLVVTEHGTHLDAFSATPEQLTIVREFLARRFPALRDNRPSAPRP